jgi:hypothetical protein
MATQRRPSKWLKYELPLEHGARIQKFREMGGGRLPYYERYLSGESRDVWVALRTIGLEVQYDPIAVDALAVAYETMHRAAENIDRLAVRLADMDYQFRRDIFAPYWRTSGTDAAMSLMFERQLEEMVATTEALPPVEIRSLIPLHEQMAADLKARAQAQRERRMAIVPPHVPPVDDTVWQIKKVIRSAGEIPFSLRAWYETVGCANFVGQHPDIAPSGVDCDPLFVAPFQFVYDLWQAWNEDHAKEGEPPPFRIPISPHRSAKVTRVSDDLLYVVTLPSRGFDAVLENEPHGLYFVDYLRLAFEWGGFPGYFDATGKMPKKLSSLKKGLLPL